MIYDIGGTIYKDLYNTLEVKKKAYGILPECLRCARNCKQYDAPDLSMFFCADFRREE